MNRRILGIAAALAVIALALVFGADSAFAQPGHEGHAHAAVQAGNHAADAGHGRITALFFWLFALGTVGGALFVITRRNLVSAVMGMVGTFFALAGLFLMLYAGFLAALQVLVYAGAIMVLFVFVIMILNKEEEQPWAIEGLLGKSLAGLGLLYLLWRMVGVLWKLKEAKPVLPAPGPVVRQVIENGEMVQRTYDFGSLRGVGQTLFTDYLFPFEAVSLVLLVAVVGAIAIARPKPPGGSDDPERAVGPAQSGEAK